MKTKILLGLALSLVLLTTVYAVEQIGCFGDSITKSSGGIGESNLYCTLLNDTLEYETFNWGNNGDDTNDLVSRMTDVTGKSYSQTIILIGTNDIAASGTTITEYYNNLINITNQLIDDGQTVLISTIPPCNDATRGCITGNQADVIKRNRVIRYVSDTQNICYSDVFTDVFNRDYDASQFVDTVHPNVAAHLLMNVTYFSDLQACVPYDCSTNSDCYNPDVNKIVIASKLTITSGSKLVIQ